MASTREAYAALIREDRTAHADEDWSGTLLDYLELVRDDPGLPKLAHARLYDAIVREGCSDIHTLWGRDVLLETDLGDSPAVLRFGEDGFDLRSADGDSAESVA